MKPLEIYIRPHKGWITAVREALGMTVTQLASRVNITPQTLSRLEKSEVRKTIRLETLAKIAPALGCVLIYALVPEKSLETYMNEQARRRAVRHFSHVAHTMLLEDQAVSSTNKDEQIEQFAAELKRRPKDLWS